MRILLVGASGFIGQHISNALAAAGHDITPLSRRHGVDIAKMLDPTHWLPHLKAVDAVINCVGIIGEIAGQRFEVLHSLAPTALFRASAMAGVRRVVQLSALGADASATTAYHVTKRAADDALRSLDLEWFVLRPTLIYGLGGRSTQLFMRMAALPVIAVVGDGRQVLQPIHVSDVVATVVQALTSPTTRLSLDVVGCQVVTFTEWLQRMRQAQGLPLAPVVQVPSALAIAAAHLGRFISPMLHPDNVRMLQKSCWADVGPLCQFLGRMPLSLDPALFFCDGAPKGATTL